ncbi:hypothetical protein [Acidipropionibacterium timonense]|uniref:hypothetical protein n=1 Tax=Acidipropionibacterium timonense TaxID=2161818 RepID=UPI0010312177|nr:hypothetical protein [Acidipropionibacterium timonense]
MELDPRSAPRAGGPIATLLSWVAILRVITPSLPAFAEADRGRNLSSRIQAASQVLIPFLAVYAAQGLLKADGQAFVHDVILDETMTQLYLDPNRTALATGWKLVAIVVIAMVARKVIAGLQLGRRNAGWASLAGYLEALWMITLSVTFAAKIAQVRAWVTSRVAIARVIDWWHRLGEVASPVTSTIEWIGSMLGDLGAVVIVPVSWLAIGAAVYGEQLRKTPPFLTPEQADARLKRIPRPVTRIGARVVEPVVTPIRSTMDALRSVASAGLVPMVLFCLTFILLNRITAATAYGLRALVGPQDMVTRVTIAPYLTLVDNLVQTIAIMALLGAAVDHVVRSQRTTDAAPSRVAGQDEVSGDAPTPATPAGAPPTATAPSAEEPSSSASGAPDDQA